MNFFPFHLLIAIFLCVSAVGAHASPTTCSQRFTADEAAELLDHADAVAIAGLSRGRQSDEVLDKLTPDGDWLFAPENAQSGLAWFQILSKLAEKEPLRDIDGWVAVDMRFEGTLAVGREACGIHVQFEKCGGIGSHSYVALRAAPDGLYRMLFCLSKPVRHSTDWALLERAVRPLDPGQCHDDVSTSGRAKSAKVA